MAGPRPTPLELIFPRIATTEFPAIRKAVEQGGIDPTDRDAFLLIPEVVELMRDLRPDEGIGDGMDFLVAVGHHAFLAWDAGSLTVPLGVVQAEALLTPTSPAIPALDEAPKAYYAQFLEHRVWATVVDEEMAEPLDGCFVHSTPGGALRVLGIFGLRPERLGFSAVEATGPRPSSLARQDGTALFASTLGADRLHSITGAEELLELGWRTLGPAREAWARAA
jgi:hypothetical protein